MKKPFYKIAFLFLVFASYSPEIHSWNIAEVTGAQKEVIEISPERSTGLDRLFVVSSMAGVQIVAKAVDGSFPTWYIYEYRGGGFAQPVSSTVTPAGSQLDNPEADKGYILEYPNSDRYYFWLTDYSQYRLRLDAVTIPAQDDCGMVTLDFHGHGEPIHYYAINGRQMTLGRDINVSYYTLDWNQENKIYNQIEENKTLDYFNENVFINPAPLCNTTFTVSGDRFLEKWGESVTVESSPLQTISVDVHTDAEQVKTNSDNSNIIGGGGDSELGGSAPADITFTAYVSDAVIHNEWQFSSTEDFEVIDQRFNDRELNYVFNEEGTTYVRFIGSNSDGSCEAVGDTYTVNIGSSDLQCPNAFSPGTSEGVNDEWKVAYRSLIEFKCWIFDRYGTQLFYFDDPQLGWDGKYKGKYVKPGVYYYVIEARGADGKNYKKGGDINIVGKSIRSTNNGGTNPTE